MLETKTAGASLDQERAYGVAMVGAHQAMATIREALGPWDDPYKNFATNPPAFYWSLSPGASLAGIIQRPIPPTLASSRNPPMPIS